MVRDGHVQGDLECRLCSFMPSKRILRRNWLPFEARRVSAGPGWEPKSADKGFENWERFKHW
jgi:hypothetical protein